jgi:hypothetical protein
MPRQRPRLLSYRLPPGRQRGHSASTALRTAFSTATSPSTSTTPLTARSRRRWRSSPGSLQRQSAAAVLPTPPSRPARMRAGPRQPCASIHCVLAGLAWPGRPILYPCRSQRGPSGASRAAAVRSARSTACHFRHDGARLQALAHNGRLIGAPPSARTAANDHLISSTSHRVDGSILLACKLMRGVESIAHGLALSHQPCRVEMCGHYAAYRPSPDAPAKCGPHWRIDTVAGRGPKFSSQVSLIVVKRTTKTLPGR